MMRRLVMCVVIYFLTLSAHGLCVVNVRALMETQMTWKIGELEENHLQVSLCYLLMPCY